MYFVYAIKSIHQSYIYVGLTNNPHRRFHQHNRGKESTTRSYAPFRNILLEQFDSRQAARTREKYLKSGTGKEFLKKL